ncbi:10680_t:CDS:2, partial [Acaulospora colombiana]
MTHPDPPRIIADDGTVQVEIFSSTKEVLYRKGFVNGRETTESIDLTVVGKLPEWLSGTFFTVGPGIFDIKYNRMIEVEGGYESGTATFSMGGKSKIFCQNHSSQIVEFNAHDLTPTRVFSWDEINPLFRGDHASPHSHYDETTGELINFNMEYAPLGTKYNFFSISEDDPSGQLIASITAKASYVHSFGVTPGFIILVIFPFYVKNASFGVKWSDNILDTFTFKPNEPTLFYVISREKKELVVTYKSDPCFAFHHINAFEDDDDNVYLDIVCYDTVDVIYDLTLENLRHGLTIGLPTAEVRRFVLQEVQRESMKFAKNSQAAQTDGAQNLLTSMFSRNPTYQQAPSWPIANYVRGVDTVLELPR